MDELERLLVRRASLAGLAEAAKQLSPGGVEVVVVGEVEAVHDAKPRLRPVGLCDRDGPAQLDDRGAREA